jgi:hypothetical protein
VFDFAPAPLRRATRAARLSVLALTLFTSSAGAQTRRIVDLELLGLRGDPNGARRNSVFVAAPAFGIPSGQWMPYIGAGLGFFTAQIRLGVFWLPHTLEGRAWVVRLEARPQLVDFFCGEPAVLGNVGVGYRWPLERGPALVTSPALYLMPSIDVGPAWLREGCNTKNRADHLDATLLYGGAGAIGLDF